MHPDHRVLTLREALQRFSKHPEKGLHAWKEGESVGLGLAPPPGKDRLWSVVKEESGVLHIEFVLHDPDEAEKFHHRFPEIEIPEEKTFPLTVTVPVPRATAAVVLDDVLDRLYPLPQEADIIWYGRASRPVTPVPTYTMGCLSLWLTLLFLGVIAWMVAARS